MGDTNFKSNTVLEQEPTQQLSDIVRWLKLFLEPGQVVELRVLDAKNPFVKSLSYFYDTSSLEQMARLAVEMERDRQAKGIYFTPNPLKPEMLRSVNRSAKDADVLRRNWLLIDVDSPRPNTKEPATDEERTASWEAVCRVQELLAGEMAHAPVVADSGNG